MQVIGEQQQHIGRERQEGIMLFKIQDSRFKIQDSRFRIQDSKFIIQNTGLKI